ELRLPVGRHRALRPGDSLPERVAVGRRQLRSLDELLGAVVVEPVLTRLEALDQRVAGLLLMSGRVPGGRVVAAADVPAGGAAAQVQPPPSARRALGASFPAGSNRLVDVARFDLRHVLPLSVLRTSLP